MSRKILPTVIVFVVLLFVFIPIADVLAQSFPGGPSGLVPCSGPECQACDLTALAQNVINFLVYFAVFVGTLMFVYAGFTYVTAGSNVEKINKAHSVFWRVFIGMIFVLSAWLVVDLIMTTFLNKDFGPWNKIECVDISTNTSPIVDSSPGEGEIEVVSTRNICYAMSSQNLRPNTDGTWSSDCSSPGATCLSKRVAMTIDTFADNSTCSINCSGTCSDRASLAFPPTLIDPVINQAPPPSPSDVGDILPPDDDVSA